MNPSNVNRKLAVAQRSQPTPQAGKNGRQALMELEGDALAHKAFDWTAGSMFDRSQKVPTRRARE